MSHQRSAARLALAALGATAALVGPLGCRRLPRAEDPAGQQAAQLERDGRLRLRARTDLAVCDAALLFAREGYLGRSASDRTWARRGERLASRWGARCQSLQERFWASYEGCASPIQGRELETFVYWDQARVAAFQQYGLPNVAVAMSTGRNRWQTSCPADFAAVTAQEAVFQAQAPLPVPITVAAAPVAGGAPAAATVAATLSPEAQQALYDAVVAMAHGQYQQALVALQALEAAGQMPIITFNIAVCLDQLGQSDEAIAAYRQVATDPTFGPRAEARIGLLGGGAEAPGEPSADATSTARAEFERGLALAAEGSYEEAISAFNRSYAAVPHPRTILNIAISYHRLGQIDAAISHYQLVVDDQALEAGLRQSAMQAIEELTRARGAVAGSPATP